MAADVAIFDVFHWFIGGLRLNHNLFATVGAWDGDEFVHLYDISSIIPLCKDCPLFRLFTFQTEYGN